MSQVTTHILDTTKGKPAEGVRILLYEGSNGDQWNEVARGTTNRDGRIIDFIKNESSLKAGLYKLRFETKDYFDKTSTATFYPYVEIIFEIKTNENYHIPLLLNPFGFSTYRGS